MSVSLGPTQLQLSIALAQDTGANQPNAFPGGSTQVTVAGLRTSVRIQNSGGLAGSEAQVLVHGLTESITNQLSTLGMVVQMVPRNTITISAGAGANPTFATRFVGTILQATPDYNSQPDVGFRFTCNATGAEQAIPIKPSSFTGAADVATIMSGIANQMGWGFENSLTSKVMLSNPYVPGTGMEQVRRVAEAARVNYAVINNVLCVFPLYGNRNGFPTPVVAPPGKAQPGQLVGYPEYTQQGIKVTAIYDPRIIFGGQIQVISSLPKATGTWNVLKVDDYLDQQVPKGEWKSVAYCYNPDFPAPLPGG